MKGEFLMTHYLTNYAYFTNKFELDEAAAKHKHEHWNEMNHTDRDVLDVIRRYSVKFGAAHLKHDTIAEAIGKSNVTARRAVRKLVNLGIIDKIHYVRPVMNGLGANIYAIRPYSDPAKIDQTTQDKPAKQTSQQDTKTTDSEEQLPVPTTLFERMKTMLASTIGKETLARRFFGVYRQQTIPMLKFSIHKHKGELFEQLGIQALQIAIQATKNKPIQNLPGYYSGVLRELIDKGLFGDAFMDYDVPVEGLYCR